MKIKSHTTISNLFNIINKRLVSNNIIYKEENYDNLCIDCEHNYVEDYIDISPDYSKRITYCTICEHTL
jgi:hypothetical protein